MPTKEVITTLRFDFKEVCRNLEIEEDAVMDVWLDKINKELVFKIMGEQEGKKKGLWGLKWDSW